MQQYEHWSRTGAPWDESMCTPPGSFVCVPVDWRARAIAAESALTAANERAAKAEAERDAMRGVVGAARGWVVAYDAFYDAAERNDVPVDGDERSCVMKGMA